MAYSKKTGFLLLIGTIIAGSLMTYSPSQAASSGSLYTYNLRDAAANVANSAGANSAVSLRLTGNWTSSTNGVTFSGDLVSKQSVGYAKPTTGYTLNVAASQAVGNAAEFAYQLPTGVTCFPDSVNVTQIGRFASGVSQVKLQLSKCSVSQTQVFPECRIAGQLTPDKTYAVTGSRSLTAGQPYRVYCMKSADPVSGQSTLTMRTVLLDAVNGDQTTTNIFSIPKTGAIQSTTYLSVGNKYPLATLANNTDQFTGTVAGVSYCSNPTVTELETCLTSELSPVAPPPVSTIDEVKYAFGNTADSVVFSWRGGETQLYFGTDNTYGGSVTATPSVITPVDITGPFMEATLTGLTPGTTYHYKIGDNGTDYTFRTAPSPADSFKAVSVGDTIASSCRTYQSAMNQLVRDQQPYFMIHGGDLAIANECGVPAVHQFYLDIEPLTRQAAFMPVWGNHEFGKPTSNAPAGTPQDTLANYKGRSFIPNAQFVPGDTPTATTDPGCGSGYSTVNTCYGKDWGWFVAGKVLFISYPEAWAGAITDWEAKVTPLMQQAQDNPDIDFIVTYGHKPVVSSTGWVAPTGYTSVFTNLGDTFSPSAQPGGKYVLNIAQHRHNLEAISSYHGVTHLVNGGGGQGLINFQTPVANSVFRMKHLGFTTLDYNADSHRLTLTMICGPDLSSQSTSCVAGSALYSQTFSRP